MKRSLRALLAALAFTALAGTVTTVTVASMAEPEAAKIIIGKPVPAFSLEDQDGKTVNLADFSGKVVVIEWFNNECPYVQKHYKSGNMNKTAKTYTEKGVVWLAVNTTKGKTNADNKKIAGEWNMDRPILNDASGTVGHLYDAKTTPEIFILTKDGALAYHGAIDSKATSDASDIPTATNYAAQALDEILSGKPVSVPETKSYGCSVKYAK